MNGSKFLEQQQLQHLSYNNYRGPGPAQVQSINASADDDVQGTMNNANPDPNNLCKVSRSRNGMSSLILLRGTSC